MIYQTLNGLWEMRRQGDEGWIEASVPGSVMSDYQRAGLIPDPYYGENEKYAVELFENDFEYRRQFRMTEEELCQDCIELVCYGLDTLADIWINDRMIGHVDNMHRIWKFNIKKYISHEINEIRIYFYSPNKYIREKDEESDITYVCDGNMRGTNFLRKAHCQFGWDWGIKLPDAGIWRNIGIQSYSTAKLEDVYIRQQHEEGRVRLHIRLKVLPADTVLFYKQDVSLKAVIEAVSPTGETYTVKQKVVPGENMAEIDIYDPQLWWPNGFGEQPLYIVKTHLFKEENDHGGMEEVMGYPRAQLLDAYECRIGLRVLTISQETDQWGKEFALKANGIKFFSMGADYIPEDAVIPRGTKARTRRLLEDCVKANFNTVRVWGGAYYPEDYFYDICDELGLVVWQDLMFACNIYVMTEEFAWNIEQEVRDNMRRIRHHACLGLWCGNNEMEMGWVDWDDVKYHPLKLKADYIRQFEYLLPKIAKEEDPDTFYWLASPSSTGSFDDPNGDDVGDVHYWDVWHGLKPFTDYRSHYFRYCSEFGFQSLPAMRTIDTFADERDKNLFSPVMELHQKRTGGNGKILHYISETYRYPKDFAALIYISQILQMESIQYGVEHWRRHRGRCMGAIYWQLNDNWPVISWSGIDYFGRWKALHYGARRFFAPVMVSILNEETRMSVYTHNESQEEIKGRFILTLREKNFNILWQKEQETVIPALSAQCALEEDFSNFIGTVEAKRSCFAECVLVVEGEVLSRQTALFTPPKHFDFEKPFYDIAVSENDDTVVITIKSNTYARFAEISLENEEVVFSDNYVDITDECGISVSVDKAELKTCANLKERVRVFSVGESYESRQ